MSREKYVPICLLADRFAWRASATNHKKKNSVTVPGQIVLIGLKGAKYCMVTWLNFCPIAQCQAQWVATHIVAVTAAFCAVSSLVSIKEVLFSNPFHGYFISTPLHCVMCVVMLTWTFAFQLGLTTPLSIKFKACEESELALTSQWGWGKHTLSWMPAAQMSISVTLKYIFWL